jgi:hypothetical protein
MAEKQILSLKPTPRLEQVGDELDRLQSLAGRAISRLAWLRALA